MDFPQPNQFSVLKLMFLPEHLITFRVIKLIIRIRVIIRVIVPVVKWIFHLMKNKRVTESHFAVEAE